MPLPANLSTLTTRCIGRYLVDIPEAFVSSDASYGQLYYGLDKNFRTVDVSVPVVTGDQNALDALADTRVQEAIDSYHFTAPSKNKLVANRRFTDGSRLIRIYDGADSTQTFKSHLYSRKGPATVIFSRDVYSHESGDLIDASLVKIADHSTFVKLASAAGVGACYGPVLINAGQDAEILDFSFESSQYPSVTLSISMNSIVAESDGGLFARVDAKADMVTKLVFHSDTLRKDKIAIGGRPGEEILETGKDHDKLMRSFTAETVLSRPSTFAQPLIAVDMTMGGQVDGQYRDAPLSNAEALALWDSIVRSIRIRPGAL